MDIHTNSLYFVGNTPLLELKNTFTLSSSLILAKMENQNPTSIKDRAVMCMVQKALEEGFIQKNTEVVEASSGNTAISIAILGLFLDIKPEYL